VKQITLFCLLLAVTFARAQAGELGVRIERNVPVPMRDGSVLRADIHRPDRGGPYPVLVQRTPYGKDGDFSRFVKAGYIVVSQDIRGRYASEGEFESLLRPKTHDGEDGYDTVEWAAKLHGSTGRVGTFGLSYAGLTQWRLAPMRPSSLVAMSANGVAAQHTYYRGNGAMLPGELRLWVIGLTPDMRRRANRPGVHTTWEARRLWKEGESRKWLNFRPVLELPKEVFEDESEVVKYSIDNPHFDPWGLDKKCRETCVPNLEFAGWYDRSNGDMLLFRTMIKEGKTETARKGSRIIIGPWTHTRLNRKYGNIDFGRDANVDKISVQIRWFDYWLKGIQNGVDKDAPVRIFVMGDNQWRDEQRWPLERTKQRIFFITSSGHANTPSGDGKLIEKEPASSDKDEYTYDPRDPASTSRRDRPWPADQGQFANRQDVLVYQTEPLTERVEVTGNPVVELHAASSAPDTDWVVRLIDVYPDGVALYVSQGIIRARYRKGFEKPSLTNPGEVVTYAIRMSATSNAFLPGHRIRLDITSSDFPNYDRNHNTAANQNADATLVTARQTIYHGGEQATRIILPWVPNPIEGEKLPEEEKGEPEPKKQIYHLHQAAAEGSSERVKLLISGGVDVNAKDEKGNTPLHYAVNASKVDVVQLLVEAGADVNARGNSNRLPLYMAVEEDNIAIAEYLIAHGADVNADRPLEDAPYYSSIEMVQLLIANGADINAGPWTALHSAVDKGWMELVELLIRNGAEVNAKDKRGNTPLHYSIQKESWEMTKLLVAKGADTVKEGLTLLHYMSTYDSRDIVEQLLAKGAKVDERDEVYEFTALHYAARFGCKNVAEVLIANGADIKAKDKWDYEPIHWAAHHDRAEVVELLISKGADVNAKTSLGQTPLQLAKVRRNKETIELLLKHGAK